MRYISAATPYPTESAIPNEVAMAVTRLLSSVAVGMVLIGLSACGGSTDATPASTAPAGSGNAVVIQNFAFAPGDLKVTAGTVVIFGNHDSTNHTVTSDTGSAQKFDSGPLQAGTAFQVTFNKAGTFTYHCSIHQYMTAKVEVG